MVQYSIFSGLLRLMDSRRWLLFVLEYGFFVVVLFCWEHSDILSQRSVDRLEFLIKSTFISKLDFGFFFHWKKRRPFDQHKNAKKAVDFNLNPLMNQTKLKSKLHRYLKLNYRFYTLIWIMLDISQRQFLQSANQHAKKSDALKWQQQPKGECMQLTNKKTKFALYIVDSTNNKSFGSSEKWIHSLFHHDQRVAPFLIVCCCCFAIITKKKWFSMY